MNIVLRLSGLVTILVLLTTCGGRPPNPVAVYQPGDERRSCAGLRAEVAENEVQIAKLVPSEDATGKNVALGVAGAFVLVPWFFMDFKDGERIEIDALRRRNRYLREFAYEKECALPPPKVIFEDKPESSDSKS